MRPAKLLAPFVLTVAALPGCRDHKTQTPPQPTTAVSVPSASASAATTAEPPASAIATASGTAAASASAAPAGKYYLQPDGTCRFYGKNTCPKEANVECSPPPPKDGPCPAGVELVLDDLPKAPKADKTAFAKRPDGACDYTEPVHTKCPPGVPCNPPAPKRQIVQCPSGM
ncbi:MAG: hypothetical protein HY908_17020 [Myxococcales bacterium]|nr:hypothetical protein [Myxococcales bacterium]